MSAYCTLDEVKRRESGDVPTASGQFDGVIAAAIIDVSGGFDHDVRLLRGEGEGWSFLPGDATTRRYTGTGAALLLIDDAVEVTSVALVRPNGTLVRALVLGTDYLPYPLNALPIVGLTMICGVWPRTLGGVSVGLTPGYATTLPDDVHNAAIEEVIRVKRRGQAGVDDRLGTEPFAPQVFASRWLANTYRVLQGYRFGGTLLRRGG